MTVLVAAWWVASPAGAQAPAVDAAAVTSQPPAPAPVLEASYALETTATEVAVTVEHAVAGAADGVAGTRPTPMVDSAIQGVTVVAPRVGSGPAAAGPQSDTSADTSAQAKGSSPASGTHSRHARPPRHAGEPSRQARPVGPQAGPATTVEAGGASRGTVAGPVDSAPDLVPSLDPASGAVDGSPASGASTSLLFGGLAILLIALIAAAPGLRRRLPARRAICPSAAFVPLLERPG